MSDSVALVAVNRVVQNIRSKITVNESLVARIVANNGLNLADAKTSVLINMAKKALALTHGDEKSAVTALVIIDGRVNRLPQCAKLLRKHTEPTVRAAYEMKDDLSFSDTSLRVLCKLVEKTDGDAEGEMNRLRDLLDMVAMGASSDRHQWYLCHIIEDRLEAGHMIESVEEEIMEMLKHPFVPPTIGLEDDDEGPTI